MEEKLLPIGSVVSTSESEEVKFMIVGFYPSNAKKEKYDYAAVVYPWGIMDGKLFIFFNHKDIKKVIAKGYENEEAIAFSENLEVWMNGNEQTEDNQPAL